MAEIVALLPTHNAAGFDCGVTDQNVFITTQATLASQLGTAQTYVLLDGNDVVAFYALATWQITLKQATPSVLGDPPQTFSIPAILLAQLGVDKKLQKGGVGKALVKHAIGKALEAAKIVGIRAMAVHAGNPDLVSYYQGLGFTSCSAAKPTYLMATLEELKAASRTNLGANESSG
jgi:GNAT superfamily N-acetyltransferase